MAKKLQEPPVKTPKKPRKASNHSDPNRKHGRTQKPPDLVKTIEFVEEIPQVVEESPMDLIQNTREMLGINRAELCRLLYISQSTLIWWEKGIVIPPAHMVEFCQTLRTLYSYAKNHVEPWLLNILLRQTGLHLLALVCCAKNISPEAFAATLLSLVSPSTRKAIDEMRQYEIAKKQALERREAYNIKKMRNDLLDRKKRLLEREARIRERTQRLREREQSFKREKGQQQDGQ